MPGRLFELSRDVLRATDSDEAIDMGLAIARGLLAVEGGRVWAENGGEGGAQFSLLVPAKRRAAGGAADDSDVS
jgi:K+-sensing histidine kinase KdpD